jgi:hypothetical protein
LYFIIIAPYTDIFLLQPINLSPLFIKK